MSELENKALVEANIPTSWGKFKMYAFDSGKEDLPHLALVAENTDLTKTVNVRLHSECLTGDVFGSLRCDCGDQLHGALKYVEENGGMIIYLRQEGRGIGLVNKLKAYNLQDAGMDTAQANIALGFHADERDFTPGVEILKAFGVKEIRLLTNNPAKYDSFQNSGIEIKERVAIATPLHDENKFYLETKRNVFGHLL
ncbi:MAG: GTP cyclohydrolase II [Flavobacteriales bacterium]